MNLLCGMLLLSSFGHVRYFSSVLYGQILLGPGTSRYETIFTVTAQKETRSTLELFTDKGEPMKASFVDETGNAASVGSSFEFFLRPDRPVRFRLALLPDEAGNDILVKTGWATFQSSEDIDALETVRITTADGKLIDRHFMMSETPPTGE